MSKLQHGIIVVTLLGYVTSELVTDQATSEIVRYQRRNAILHDMLVADGCPDLFVIRQKRELFTPSVDDIQLVVEKQMYEELSSAVVDCKRRILLPGATTTNSTKPAQMTTMPDSLTSTMSPPSTSAIPIPTQCLRAINLTESWRKDNKGKKIKPNDGKPHCESKFMIPLGLPWFRFSGAAGTQLLNTCPPAYSCGSNGAMWSGQRTPTVVGKVTRFTFYSSSNYYNQQPQKCYLKSYAGEVIRCSSMPGDFVYRVTEKQWGGCDYAFCGMDI